MESKLREAESRERDLRSKLREAESRERDLKRKMTKMGLEMEMKISALFSCVDALAEVTKENQKLKDKIAKWHQGAPVYEYVPATGKKRAYHSPTLSLSATLSNHC